MMDREAVIGGLKNIIGDYLQARNMDLVDFIYRYEGKDLVLRILADNPEGGISLGECACLNRDISRLLDEQDIIQERYTLEVSSPGLDRPLKTKSDFLRCSNKKVKFFFSEPVNGKFELEGIINKAGDDTVFIDIANQTVEAPLAKIRKAKQVL
jgi:ribosome maturation factor RimP